eukprot:2172148-Pyramimonas_sp.AAC.1
MQIFEMLACSSWPLDPRASFPPSLSGRQARCAKFGKHSRPQSKRQNQTLILGKKGLFANRRHHIADWKWECTGESLKKVSAAVGIFLEFFDM